MKTKLLSDAGRRWLAGFALLLAGCSEWRYDVTELDVAFSRVRTESHGRLIGQMKEDAVVAGRPCRRGWLHLHANGVPSAFTAAREFSAGKLTVPAGTWVFQTEGGVVKVCAFPRDTEVQGQVCRGTGGPKGVQAAFYADGALKQFYLPADTRIQGILCDSGLINSSVELHENGRLKSCVLAEEVSDLGRTFRKGTRVRFDREGRMAEATAP